MQRKVKISLHFFLFCYIQFPKSNLKENRMYYPYSYRKGMECRCSRKEQIVEAFRLRF